MKEQPREFENIVIGATFYGCGLAAREPSETLLLDAGTVPGWDFALTFDPGDDWDADLRHPAAGRFRNALRDKQVLKDGALHCGAVASVFAGWCLEQNLRLEFLSQTLEADEREVRILNPSGIVHYRARNVIDARPRTGPTKHLTALLAHPERDAPAPARAGAFQILASPFPDESYLRMEIPGDLDWIEARRRFYLAWDDRDEALRDYRIVLLGTRFATREYANPCLALDHGLGAC